VKIPFSTTGPTRLDVFYTSLVKFYLVSRKTFLFYSILTFHKVLGFFVLQKIEVLTYFCVCCMILCCWIKHSTWHCRVAIQFEYCFSIIGQYIDIYGYGMLSMGFWLLSRRSITMCIFGKRSQRAIIDCLCRMCVVCYNVNGIHSTGNRWKRL
jgi:hypothetical protein